VWNIKHAKPIQRIVVLAVQQQTDIKDCFGKNPTKTSPFYDLEEVEVISIER